MVSYNWEIEPIKVFVAVHINVFKEGEIEAMVKQENYTVYDFMDDVNEHWFDVQVIVVRVVIMIAVVNFHVVVQEPINL